MALEAVRLDAPIWVSVARATTERIDASIDHLIVGEAPNEAPIDLPAEEPPRAVRLLLRIHAALLHFASLGGVNT